MRVHCAKFCAVCLALARRRWMLLEAQCSVCELARGFSGGWAVVSRSPFDFAGKGQRLSTAWTVSSGHALYRSQTPNLTT